MYYPQVDHASLLRHAAESLANEGRHNQASVLKDAAQAIDELKAELAKRPEPRKEG